MPNTSEKPLSHVHWRIYKEDNERLHALFGHDRGGMNRAIRAMVHSFLNQNYATLHAKIDEIETHFGASRTGASRTAPEDAEDELIPTPPP